MAVLKGQHTLSGSLVGMMGGSSATPRKYIWSCSFSQPTPKDYFLRFYFNSFHWLLFYYSLFLPPLRYHQSFNPVFIPSAFLRLVITFHLNLVWLGLLLFCDWCHAVIVKLIAGEWRKVTPKANQSQFVFPKPYSLLEAENSEINVSYYVFFFLLAHLFRITILTVFFSLVVRF